MSGSSWVSSHFLLFLFFFTIIASRFSHGIFVEKNVTTTTTMVPLIENEPKMMMDLGMGMMMNVSDTRRKLGRFKICALCTCCGGPKGICLPSPCCYAINCNIPNRPFGFCSFTPKTCNCFGCHL